MILSFPNIPNITPLISVTPGQTVPLLLASIALEELALAHIINAEAEKLQFVLGTLPPGRTTLSPAVVSAADLLAIDSSVQRTLRDVIKKEMLLEFKFENVLDLISATGGGGPTPATCGCGVSLTTGVTTGPITVTTFAGAIDVASVTLDFGICASCSSAGSTFDLAFTTIIVPIAFALDSITSVTCAADVATIIGTASVTVDGLPSITGDVTIIVNGPAGTVTVTVTSGPTTLLSLTIPVPVASLVFNTCP